MAGKANSDQITRDYLDSILLETRYVGADIPSTKIRIFGEEFDSPIMTGALSHLNKIHDKGLEEIAHAAKKVNYLFWCGMGEEEELEGILSTGAKVVKIIKPHKDNKEVLRKIRHAVDHGAFAVGMDIDHAFNGNGGYDNVFGLEMRPKTVEELRMFKEAAGVPFVVKGVLSVQDALACAEAGVDGILLSHHHGIMDFSVPPMMALPEILEAVGGRMPVFVDCGIESGMDVFKCLALGATAVGVGRELMKPLKEGREAVAARMKEMNGELMAIMARTGFHSLSEIDDSVLWFRDF